MDRGVQLPPAQLLASHIRKGFDYAKQRCTAYPRYVVQRSLFELPHERAPLGVVTSRAQQVIGIHFNPVPVLKLVELVPSLLTSQETGHRSRAFVEGVLGKVAIDCPDRAGFVVNALLIPLVLSSIRMLESGFATAEDIDRGLVLGARVTRRLPWSCRGR